MMKRPLALAVLVALPALAWLSSSASPTAAPRDPSVLPLPPEAFALIDDWTTIEEGETIECTFYNGSEYRIESLDIEVELSDFEWAGNEHNSRTWTYRCSVDYGSTEGLPLDLTSVARSLNVDVNAATAKLVAANGYIP